MTAFTVTHMFQKKIDGENKNWWWASSNHICAILCPNGSRKYNELKARWTAKTFCKKYFCNRNEVALLESQLINMFPKEIGANRTVKEHQEYHTFIIFSNVNDKTRNDILTYLSKAHMFLPLKLVSHNTVTHCSGLFTETWFKNFYGNSYYHIFDASRNQQSMADHKGSGTFTWLIIKDLHPVYNEIPGKGHVNQNVYNLKSSLRHWVVNKFSLHTSQNFVESSKDLTFFVHESMLPKFVETDVRRDPLNNLNQWIYVDKLKSAVMRVPTSEVTQTIARGELYHLHLDVKDIQKDFYEALYDTNESDIANVEYATLVGGIILAQTRFPIVAHVPGTARWYRGMIGARELGGMMIINAKSWWDLGQQCATVSDFASKYVEKGGSGSHFAKVRKMMDSVHQTERTVTAVTSDWIHYTLYDGNHRSIYFYMNATKSTESHMVSLLIGYSPDFARPYKATSIA